MKQFVLTQPSSFCFVFERHHHELEEFLDENLNDLILNESSFADEYIKQQFTNSK